MGLSYLRPFDQAFQFGQQGFIKQIPRFIAEWLFSAKFFNLRNSFLAAHVVERDEGSLQQ